MADEILYFYNERGYQKPSKIDAKGATAVVPGADGQALASGQVWQFDGTTWNPTAPDAGAEVTTAFESYTSVTAMHLVTSAADGTAFVAFGAQPCTGLDVLNNSAADIVYKRTGQAATITIKAGSSRLVRGITDAGQVSVRRADNSNASVTIEAEAFQP